MDEMLEVTIMCGVFAILGWLCFRLWIFLYGEGPRMVPSDLLRRYASSLVGNDFRPPGQIEATANPRRLERAALFLASIVRSDQEHLRT
jgi:hypothetical protein